MSIYIGGSKLKNCFLGTSRVKKIYLGTSLVFSIGSLVDVNLCYGGTQYGHTYGSKIGTIKWQKNSEAWSGDVSDVYFTEDSGKFTYGDIIRIKDIVAAPGFALGNVTKNGTAVGGSSGVYSMEIDADAMNINVNYNASTANTTATTSHLEVLGTNSVSKTAWTVTFKFSATIGKLEAGVPFANIPAQYRPASNKSINTGWYYVNDQLNSNANITVKTNGDVVSDSVANGSGSAGGKWGGGSWSNKVNFTMTWSVI